MSRKCFGTVKVLIANGAKLDICNGAGTSPLSKAVFEKDLETIKILLENGASMNHNDFTGWTPFLNSIRYKPNLEMIKFLMENGADLKIRTKHSKNSALELALMVDEINIVKKLIY